jgi:hypothetical protein
MVTSELSPKGVFSPHTKAMSSKRSILIKNSMPLLIRHFKEMGLTVRPKRKLMITKGGAAVTIIPVVNLSPSRRAFHDKEGAISVSSDGGIIGCVVTIDNRTSISSAQFFHVIKNKVIEGPEIRASELGPRPPPGEPSLPPSPPDVRPRPSPGPDPSTIALEALRTLSLDEEARGIHPDLNYAELFSEENEAFVEKLSTDMFRKMRGGGLIAIDISTSTSSSCTGCTSCSTSCAASATSDPLVGNDYLSFIHPDHMAIAQILAKNIS